MEDQRREWELRDNKLREQNEARQELMKRVYQIRADQIAYRLSLKFYFFEKTLSSGKMKNDKKLKKISENDNVSKKKWAASKRLNQDEIKVEDIQRKRLTFSDIANTNRSIQSYLVDQMNELSVRQADERAQAMREHAADLEREAKDQQRIRDALKHYGAY